ncbi:MAG: outer membrane protein assembly factor BamC [Burkholderiales bacterium]
MRTTGLVLVLLSLLMAGCSGKLADSRRIDYKSAGKLPPLEVPPDLASPQADDRYAIPEAGGGVATYSEYSEDRGTRTQASGEILPEAEGVRVERGGTQRWLVIDAEPEAVWPTLREFWQDTGFLIARESPEVGILETDWAENRARIPQSGIRRVLGSVLDNVYSYPERDKFRTRVERREDGGTDIFISHRGMYEVVVGERQSEKTMWQARPSDPELEAEMLYRLMARLGGNERQARAAANEPPPEPRATINRSTVRGSALFLEDPFDRAWRRVGLALDRVGFTVEDRDRSKGVFYVRYADPEVDNRRTGLARLAFWRSTPGPKDEQFQISIENASEERSEVKVLDAAGAVAESETATRILGLLHEQLK